MMLVTAIALTLCAPGPRDNCIVDGDTAWVQGEKIRLANIDAPEIAGRCSFESALAQRAKLRLHALLQRPFQIHRVGLDRYKRTLVTITVDGRDVGDQLVKEGLARTWSGRREPWC